MIYHILCSKHDIYATIINCCLLNIIIRKLIFNIAIYFYAYKKYYLLK